MAKRGRPRGTIVRLLDDPGRFEVVVWFAFTELGLSPYRAAYLTHFLITIDRPITTESIDGVLLRSTTTGRGRVIGHADRIRRKAPAAIARADELEQAWLIYNSGLVFALVNFAANSDVNGFGATLKLLREAGWTDTLDRIGKRLSASLQTNFPPAAGQLSRAAARLLAEAHRRAAE